MIEYCGEVMSDTVALSRLRSYEAAGILFQSSFNYFL